MTEEVDDSVGRHNRVEPLPRRVVIPGGNVDQRVDLAGRCVDVGDVGVQIIGARSMSDETTLLQRHCYDVMIEVTPQAHITHVQLSLS